MSYTDQHKIFLQIVMHEGVLHDQDGKELLIKLFKHDNMLQVINEINTKLKPINMMIKKISCEVTGKKYWALINSVFDKNLRLPTEFSEVELALLKLIFSEIITSDNGCISSTKGLNLCSSLDVKLLKADAQEFLNKMIERKWLHHQDGKYYMGVRSMAELMPYFKATHDDSFFNTCFLCNQTVFYGGKCPHCRSFIHLPCLKAYFTIQSSIECSKCKNLIAADDFHVDYEDVNDI